MATPVRNASSAWYLGNGRKGHCEVVCVGRQPARFGKEGRNLGKFPGITWHDVQRHASFLQQSMDSAIRRSADSSFNFVA
jgi:hypothetical protein